MRSAIHPSAILAAFDQAHAFRRDNPPVTFLMHPKTRDWLRTQLTAEQFATLDIQAMEFIDQYRDEKTGRIIFSESGAFWEWTDDDAEWAVTLGLATEETEKVRNILQMNLDAFDSANALRMPVCAKRQRLRFPVARHNLRYRPFF